MAARPLRCQKKQMNQPALHSTRQPTDAAAYLPAIALAALVLVPIVRLMDSPPLVLELLTHFQLHYALASAVLVGLFVWRRRRVQMVVALAALVFNGSAVIPWYSPLPRAVAGSGGVSLRLMHANVNAWNDDYDSFAELVRRERPDVLVVQEFSTPWRNALPMLDEVFPHSIGEISDGPFGIALYSRYPLSAQRVVTLGRAGIPSLEATLDVEGTAVRLLSTHPFPPVGSGLFDLRNDQLDAVATALRGTPQSSILVGDLNATPWSPYYRALESATGLRNVRTGFGLVATWPSILGPLGIPIDHVLVSNEFGVTDVRAGSTIGSDHLPLIVDLAVGG